MIHFFYRSHAKKPESGTENYYLDVRSTGSYVKVIRMFVGEMTTTPLRKNNVGRARALFDP